MTVRSESSVRDRAQAGGPIEKPADTHYPILDLLRRRWSPRAFSERPIEREKLLSLFEAARWSPSSSNEQPWSFIVATKEDRAAHERLFSCLVEGNKIWAGRPPVLMLSVAKLFFDEDRSPNRHAFHDVGQATAYLTVQATALGLAVHQMAGFDVEKARKDLAIPEGYEPDAMVVIGYPGDPAVLPDRLRQRELAPRQRKPIQEFVFAGRWGEKWSPG
jgi:nitroreductase